MKTGKGVSSVLSQQATYLYIQIQLVRGKSPDTPCRKAAENEKTNSWLAGIFLRNRAGRAATQISRIRPELFCLYTPCRGGKGRQAGSSCRHSNSDSGYPPCRAQCQSASENRKRHTPSGCTADAQGSCPDLFGGGCGGQGLYDRGLNKWR